MASIDSVIRRRIVLAALLLAALALSTAYYRETTGGPLHGFQRSANTAARPFESAAQRVARPFRDAWDYTVGLIHTRQENSRLRREVKQLEFQRYRAADQSQELAALRVSARFVHDPKFGRLLDNYEPVGANVIYRTPTLTASVVSIDAGAADGLRRFDPVVTGDGWLVGQVGQVGQHTAQVVLLNDSTMAVGVVVPTRNADGIVRPSAGNGSALRLTMVPKAQDVRRNDVVITSGWRDRKLGIVSHFPRGLPVGQVTSVLNSETDLYKEIQVQPAADLPSFLTVTVLVARGGS